ncbi:MAG: hypothetical protein O3A92_11555 [Verrucomicrobia bacterium]|nr:hypothetical protein [Verrucomicrobiota bacterium]
MKRTLIGLLLLVAVAGRLAGESLPESYRKWHDQCMTEDTGQIDVQIARFEGRIAADGKDQLARAYLGSACALRAKAGFWGPTKLKYLNRGKAYLEASVAGAPNDPRVRMVRAIGYYKVPERFGTRPTSVKDFEFLIPIAREGKGGLKMNERQVILYYASLVFAEEGKAGAGELRKACHGLDPESRYGVLTR